MKFVCLGYIEPGKFEGMTGDERHSARAFKPLRREISITPFSLSHSFQVLRMDLDRLRYGRVRI